MNYLQVKDLIHILRQYNEDLPLVITHAGKDHQYGLTKQGIYTMHNPYFGNDTEAQIAFDEARIYLNLGSI